MTSLPQPSPTVVACDVEGGAVLLSTESETYFGLNAVGAKIWSLLPQHASIESLCQALQREYPEVEMAVLVTDATELLDDLRKGGLVS
ncbi:MAG TPA: PqqD family protein [Gemmatimonadales bacterium]|nr:PqqD family protein [Gemmatimonadales bacterium]